MKYHTTIFLISAALAQRPTDTPICDYYAATILGNNTETSQGLLITLLINTVVLGNYTTPNVGIPVHGIASPAVYNGTQVALLPYFTPELESTNLGGDHGVSKAFLDDGAATALAKNMSSNGNVNSAQYKLLTHIYQYFGTLLGCSKQGGDIFPAYLGRTSMYEVHRFMDFNTPQASFFTSQVLASASSLGFAQPDVDIFGNTLNTLFNTRCAPPIAVKGIAAPPELQSVCVAEDCPLDPNANCSAYPNDGVAVPPVNATAAMLSGNGTANGTNSSASSSGAPAGTVPASVAAEKYGAWVATLVVAVFACFFVLGMKF